MGSSSDPDPNLFGSTSLVRIPDGSEREKDAITYLLRTVTIYEENRLFSHTQKCLVWKTPPVVRSRIRNPSVHRFVAR